MIIGNDNPIRIIGYSESSMTQEFFNEIQKTHPVEIISPNALLTDINKRYQYIVSISFDLAERKNIINVVDKHNLDLITVICDTVMVGQVPKAIIHPGTFIFPFCNIAIASAVGRHCIVGAYSQIGHYSVIKNNCILRPGVMITGKSIVGENCVINTRSTVTNNSTITNDVEIMAFTNVIKNITKPGKYIGSIAKRQSDL